MDKREIKNNCRWFMTVKRTTYFLIIHYKRENIKTCRAYIMQFYLQESLLEETDILKMIIKKMDKLIRRKV